MERDEIACGFCKNESICKIHEEYMKSKERKQGGTADLAKKCGKYIYDGRANPAIWGQLPPQ